LLEQGASIPLDRVAEFGRCERILAGKYGAGNTDLGTLRLTVVPVRACLPSTKLSIDSRPRN
jgi:hypothetical protein